MPKKNNDDVAQTTEAIDHILAQKEDQKVKSNRYLPGIYEGIEKALNKQLYELCRQTKPSKKE